jgi:flavin-dependent dehydrogenase
MRLLERRRDVIILDRPQSVRPWGGESFSGAIRAPLEALGIWDEFAKAGHVRGYERQVAWGSEPYSESSMARPNGHMWHVDRDRFDEDLRQAVRRRASVFLTYRRLRTITRTSGIWRLTCDEGSELRAQYLVDATGRSRALAKRLGASVTSYDRLIGLTARGPDNKGGCGVASLMIQSTPFGWWYAAPVPRGHVVALFTDADLAPSAVRQCMRPVAANSAFTQMAASEGWLAVGDACASHDPLCGWGVHRALSNGVLAADAIDDHLRTGSPTALKGYGHHCWKQFDGYLEGLTRHYSMERRWANTPFWERRLDRSRKGGLN